MEHAKRHIFLTGFMGSGKSSLGKKLASLLKWPFQDLDQHIEKQEGIKVAEIFDQKGENYFREIEKKCLIDLCASPQATIISLGGGSLLDQENLALIKKQGTLFYLQLTPAALFSRLKTQVAERPLLRGLSEEQMQTKIAELLRLREPHYQQADYCLQGINLEARDIQHILIEKGIA